jgi:hypothetical protein
MSKISKSIITIIVKYIGYNPNIEFECKFLEQHLDKLDWEQISKNGFIPYSFLSKYQEKIIWRNLYYRQDMPLNLEHLNEMNWEDSLFPISFIEENLLLDRKQENYMV